MVHRLGGFEYFSFRSFPKALVAYPKDRVHSGSRNLTRAKKIKYYRLSSKVPWLSRKFGTEGINTI